MQTPSLHYGNEQSILMERYRNFLNETGMES